MRFVAISMTEVVKCSIAWCYARYSTYTDDGCGRQSAKRGVFAY